MLTVEEDSPAVRDELLRAARFHEATCDTEDHRAEYVNGRWSLLARDRQGQEVRFSVHEAEGGPAVDGFDFERVA